VTRLSRLLAAWSARSGTATRAAPRGMTLPGFGAEPAPIQRPRSAPPPRGMTLIEILVVVTILGLIAAAVAVNVVGQLGEAKVKQARTDLHTLENCLDLYKIDKGNYPTTEEGLKAVVAAGKCKPQLKDPWGTEYIYLYPGLIHPDSFDVKSYGADRQPGGEGENADIVNP
jgi:general secretion pathway protein G